MTALAVNIELFAAHIAGLPVAVNAVCCQYQPSCAQGITKQDKIITP